MGPPPQPPLGRHSLGGGEARRVILQQPWKVKDLVVPPPSATSSGSSASSSTFAQPSKAFPTYPPAVPQLQPRTPIRSAPVLGVRPGVLRPFPAVATPGILPQRVSAGSTPLPPPATPRTPAVSAEERKAIQERRRSAVKEAFVLGSGAASAALDGVPGMSPSKASPAKPMRTGAFEGGAATPRRSLLFPSGSSTSPTKGRPLGYTIPEHEGESGYRRVSSEGEDEVSTDEMLERMRETVESMKRRRSLALGGGSAASTPVRGASVGEARALGGMRTSLSPKKLDFARLGKNFTTPETETVPEVKIQDPMDLDEEAESAVAPPPLPSLLRTPARSTEVPVVRVEVAEPMDEEEMDPAPATTKAKPRARLLRAPAPEAPKEDPMLEVEDHVEEPVTRSSAKPPSRSRTVARSRSRSPLPPAPVPVARSTSRPPVTPTEEADDATLAVPVPKMRSARSRSRTPQLAQVQPEKVEYHPTEAAVDEEAEVETEAVEEVEEEAKPVKKTTRVRGAASNKAKPAAAPTPDVAAPPRARSRSRAPVPVPDEPEAEPEPQVTKIVKPKATRGRPKKVTAAPSEDEMDNDDELGSYQMVTPGPSVPAKAKASSTKKATLTTKTPAAAAKPPSKIASGSRSTGSKRTKTPVQIKQEEEAELEPAPVAKRSSSKANIKTKTPVSTTEEDLPSKPAPAKRGRPRKNDTATPVASVPANEEEEKENTPGPSAASDEAEEQQQVVKVRVSRRAGTTAKTATTKASSSATKTKAGSKLKVPKEEEQVDEPEEEREEERKTKTTGGRTTRVMRMRTRTG